jgi:hypothetical protein
MAGLKKNRAAALKTERALCHHAKPLLPIKRALQDALHYSGLMHRVESAKGGQNSWKLVLDDGRVYELRGRLYAGPPHIEVRKQGTLGLGWAGGGYDLFNERDVLRFVEAL